jgi:hypothetical protein
VNRVLYHHSGQYSTLRIVVQGRRMSALLAATKVAKSHYRAHADSAARVGA